MLRVLQRAGRRWVYGLVIPILLIWRKNDILFSRYLDFCDFVKSTDFKICDVIIGIASSGISTYAYFFWILSTLKKKFRQILVCCKINISNMFLALEWRLETSSRLFYDFIKMTILRDLAIFNSYPLQLLNVHYLPFRIKQNTGESWHNWLLSNWSRFLNWKGTEN